MMGISPVFLLSHFLPSPPNKPFLGLYLPRLRGSEIDQHDMVLRFNSAPTKGFEKLVGSKTTHRITNTQNWCFRESDKEHIMVHMRSTASLAAVIRTHVVSC